MTKVYDHSFNANEWFVIILLVVLHVALLITPKLLSTMEGVAHYLHGIFWGMFYDHTISVPPWDFYDVNDSSAYQLLDFLSYVMYGPFSYFYIYLLVKWKIRGFPTLIYVLSFAGIALCLEWIGLQIGLYHYDKGYKMYWSPTIYLFTLSMHLLYFHLIKKQNQT